MKKFEKNSNLPTKATTNHNDDNGNVRDAFPIGLTIRIDVRINQIVTSKTKSAAVALTSCEKNSKKNSNLSTKTAINHNGDNGDVRDNNLNDFDDLNRHSSRLNCPKQAQQGCCCCCCLGGLTLCKKGPKKFEKKLKQSQQQARDEGDDSVSIRTRCTVVTTFKLVQKWLLLLFLLLLLMGLLLLLAAGCCPICEPYSRTDQKIALLGAYKSPGSRLFGLSCCYVLVTRTQD